MLLRGLSQRPMRAYRPAAAPSVRVHATAATAVRLGPFQFSSKDAARDRIREVLRQTYTGDMILPNTEDGQLLLGLVQQHPNAADKIGAGVSYFTTARRSHNNVPTKHFILHRIDGTSTDFSYLKCLNMQYSPSPKWGTDNTSRYSSSNSSSSSSSGPGSPIQSWDSPYDALPRGSYPIDSTNSSSSSSSTSSSSSSSSTRSAYQDPQQGPQPVSTYRKALRAAVKAQSYAFKAYALSGAHTTPLMCPLEDIPLSETNSFVLETEETPFLDLVDQWLDQEGYQLQEIPLQQDPQRGNVFMADKQQRFSWQEFYRVHAQLKLVSLAGYSKLQEARKGSNSNNNSSSGGGSYGQHGYVPTDTRGQRQQQQQYQQQEYQQQEYQQQEPAGSPAGAAPLSIAATVAAALQSVRAEAATAAATAAAAAVNSSMLAAALRSSSTDMDAGLMAAGPGSNSSNSSSADDSSSSSSSPKQRGKHGIRRHTAAAADALVTVPNSSSSSFSSAADAVNAHAAAANPAITSSNAVNSSTSSRSSGGSSGSKPVVRRGRPRKSSSSTSTGAAAAAAASNAPSSEVAAEEAGSGSSGDSAVTRRRRRHA